VSLIEGIPGKIFKGYVHREQSIREQAHNGYGMAPGSNDVVQPALNRGAGLIGSFLGGAAVIGGVAAAIKYRNSRGFSRFISDTFQGGRVPTLDMVSGEDGVLPGMRGSLNDLIKLAANTKDFKKIDPLIEALERRAPATGDTGTIRDYLFRTGSLLDPEKMRIRKAITTLSAQHKVDPNRIYNLGISENVVLENGELRDYRANTIKGLAYRALNWASDNLVVPGTSFAPTDLFMHNAWGHGQKSAVIKGGQPIGRHVIDEDAFLMGDTLVSKSGKDVIRDKFVVIDAKSALGAATAQVKGIQGHKTAEELLETGQLGPIASVVAKLQAKLRRSTMSPSEIAEVNRLIARGETKKANELLQAAGGPGNFLITPEAAKDHSLFQYITTTLRRFSGKSELTTGVAPSDLNWLEKGQKWLGLTSSKGKWKFSETIDGVEKEIKMGARGPSQIYGFEKYEPGVYAPKKVASTLEIFDRGQIPVQHLATTRWGFAKSFTQFMADRPLRMFESITGLGIKQSTNPILNMFRNPIMMGLAFSGTVELLAYANYLLGGVPAKATAAGLGGTQLAYHGAMEVTGIQPVTSFLEENFPGIMDSALSKGARLVGLAALGRYAGSKLLPSTIDLARNDFSKKLSEYIGIKLLTGRAVGSAIGMALGISTVLMDPTKSFDEAYNQVSGAEKVEVKNARWWTMGRQPFEGDGIKYYDWSIVQKLWHHDAKAKAIYGSESAKFAHSFLPTPTNLFGLIPAMDPYYVENRNAALNPYPVIAPMGSNIPVWGPIIGGTIGNILKPEVNIDVHSPIDATLGSYGVSGAATQLGYSDPGGQLEPRDGMGLRSTANAAVNKLQDYAGLFGFLSEMPLRKLTGSDTGFGEAVEYESSANLTDQGRAFSELNLGGGLGQTELLRRLFNPRASNVNYYNPMPNEAPTWLPGSNSQFESDRDYKIDFHTGALISKVEKGEYRLPGAGYEEFNKLHGGEGYDIVDKYNILSDVAPGSMSHLMHKRAVQKYIMENPTDEEALQVFQTREAENQERMKGIYRFSGSDALVTNPDAGEAGTGPGGPMGDQARGYLSFVNSNYQQTPDNPVLYPLQRAWQAVTHTRVPGLAWLQGKFMHKRTPREEYIASHVQGTGFADWENPYAGFIEPAGAELVGAAASLVGMDYVPSFTEKKWEVEEYYDKLKYLKARRLADRAESMGNANLAATYQQEMQQTVVGMDLDPETVNRNIFKALPQNMRPFVGAFANATPEEAAKIEPYLPSYQKHIWNTIWSHNQQGAPTGGSRREIADAEVASYFSQRATPDLEANVWNPNVDINEYKLKTLQAEGLNPFEQGIYKTKAREYNLLNRSEIIIDTSPFRSDVAQRNRLEYEMNTNVDVRRFRVNSSSIKTNSVVSYHNPRMLETYNNADSGRF